MNAQTARKQELDVNWYWTGSQLVREMDQKELLEYADYLGALSNETFLESSNRFRNEGDSEIADIFEEMETKWFEIEE